MEALWFALSSLWSHKMRSVLTTLGIIIGVQTVISIVAVVQGLNQSFERQLNSWGSNVLYVSRWSWFSDEPRQFRRNRKPMEPTYANELLSSCPGLSAVSVEADDMFNIRSDEGKTLDAVQVQGVWAASQEISNMTPALGRMFTDLENEHHQNVAFIGPTVRDQLFPVGDPLGRKVIVGGQKFTVIGVQEKRGKFLGFDQDNFVAIPHGTYTRHFAGRSHVQLLLQVRKEYPVEEARQQVIANMRRLRKLHPGQADDFAVNQQDMIVQMYKAITGAAYLVMIGVGALSLVVGGIGIMNIMLVSVTERTKEIGIRKALGATRRAILAQFVVEATFIAMAGGLVGVASGWGIAELVDRLSPLPAHASLASIVLGVLFSACIGLFFGIYPANKAARLDPIECLRFE